MVSEFNESLEQIEEHKKYVEQEETESEDSVL